MERYVKAILNFYKTKSIMKKYYHSILLFFAVGLMFSFASCDPAKKYEETERESIANYLNSNLDKEYELKTSGLYYLEVLTGTGVAPVQHDTAYVLYTGMYLNGTVFDPGESSNGVKDTLVFPVAEGWLIPGFDEGITYMKEGGKASFLIPSKLGYGSQGYYTIQGYTPLLYDVELVRVKPGPVPVK